MHPCDGTHCPIGTLQSDKGDIHENAAEKSTLHPVELFRDYPKAPFYLKEGNLGWSRRERGPCPSSDICHVAISILKLT